MQTFRLFPVIVLVALGANPLIVHAQDTPAQAAARAALMQKMNEMDEESPQIATNTPPPAPVTPPVMTPQTNNMNAVPPPPVTTPQPAPTMVDTNMPAMAPMTNMPAMTPTPTPTNPPPVVTNVTNTPAPGTPPPPQEQPIGAPPLPISSSQQAQLQALLQQYQANQITPEQYQAARAKILGGQ
jgi:hypothetical protein